LLERFFAWAQFISIATWLWGTRSFSRTLEITARDHFELARSRHVEFYMLGWFLVLLLGGTLSLSAEASGPALSWLRSAISCAGALRIADILQANVNMHVFDGARLSREGEPAQYVASQLRSTLISVWNYLELIGWFAILYLQFGGLQNGACSRDMDPMDALYFSTITQLTIGFGDLTPAGRVARSLAMAQGLLGTLFIIFGIGRFAAMLPHPTDQKR
jgi:hypothetical protein